MNGSANLSATGRNHYASAIPVPRSFSPGRLPASVASSPKLSTRQASTCPATSSLVYGTQKSSSPRPVKSVANCSGSTPKNPKQKCSPRNSVVAHEKRTPVLENTDITEGKQAVGWEGSLTPSVGSPWSSPRLGQKTPPRMKEIYKKTMAYATEKDNEKDTDRKPEEVSGSNANKMTLGKSGTVSGLICENSHSQSKAPTRFSLYTESVLLGSIEALKMKRPQSCPVKGQCVSEVNSKFQENTRVPLSEEKLPTTLLHSGSSQPNGLYPQVKGVTSNSGTINLSAAMPQTPPVTATVAPFQYRLQQGGHDENDSSDGDCDDSLTLSDVTEISYMDLEMLKLTKRYNPSGHK